MRVCSRPRGTQSSPKLRRTTFVTTRPERPSTAQPPCKRLPVPSLTAPSWPGRTGLNPEAASRRRGGRSRSLVAEPRVRGAPRGRARGPGWRGEAQGRHRSAVGCGAGRGGWAVARRGAARGTGDAGGAVLIARHVVLVLQLVPALDLLVLVFQTLVPVFQALSFGRDPQLAASWMVREGGDRRSERTRRAGISFWAQRSSWGKTATKQ